MISTHIPIGNPQNDNFRRLASYIADASNRGEKTLHLWTEGCLAGEDYSLAVDEVRATQACNQRTTREKTYHLVVSFHPEDAQKLTLSAFQEVEREMARSMGFEDHQRCCGVHNDTDNIHMHVAYNMIHPKTKSRRDPYFDYLKRDKLCRELENKYGLKVDPGRDVQADPERLSSKIRKQEAHSGIKSFASYVKERKELLQNILAGASTWQDLHKGLAKYGIAVSLSGAGCVLAAIGSRARDNHKVKAGEAGRNFSKGNLEKKLGPYEPSKGNYLTEEYYDVAPAKRLRSRKEKRMWKVYVRERALAEEGSWKVKRSWKEFRYQMDRYFSEGIER